jgi:uncharacterized protein with PQ loop repeat
MKRPFLRFIIISLSAGWIIPFGIFCWSIYDFVWNVMWPTLALNDNQVSTFHPIQWGAINLIVSMVWLVIVIIGWSLYLTRERNSPI